MTTPENTVPPALPVLASSPVAVAANARQRNAVALTYAAAQGAPRVVAKGSGIVADRIVAVAREHGVFVHESRELVGLLMQVDLDDEIPPALYRAVAELLAWLYQLEAAATPHRKEG